MSEFYDEEPVRSMSELFGIGSDRSPGFWYKFILRCSQWYAFMVQGRDMGPGLGVVSMELTNRNLRHAVPDGEPPAEMLDAVRGTIYDSNPSEILGRANRWSAALQSRVVAGELRIPARTVLTTYGLVSFRTGIRLSVIHYLEPTAVFGLRRPPVAARIDGNNFPVIIRPSAFVPMSTRKKLKHSPSRRGNIWLKVQHEKSVKLGYLTANHAVEEARLGAVVNPPTFRSPPEGVLTHRSEVIDCAVVRTDFDSQFDFRTVHVSTVIGYKPVRLVTDRGDIDAQVVECSGHIMGVIPSSEGREEPSGRVVVVFNRLLGKGDSGCLVVDCEIEKYDKPAAPYAMYLGKFWGPIQGLGVGQLLEQARQHWDLEFCEPREDEDERKPSIGG
jgi:hypothetical protein